jgi:ubiquinone/menaquinone biosynthesis C-methylase UbiE
MAGTLGGLDALKRQQAQHHDDAWRDLVQPEFEASPYVLHFRRILYRRVFGMLDAEGIDLGGRSVLLASCGLGEDLHYLRERYEAEYTATDISERAIEIVTRTFPGVSGRLEDTERLSFPDDSFDWSYVSTALHHLPRPAVGLYELLRVSREGVIAVEPNDSWLARLATRAGLATEIEECGNFVYRFGRRDVERMAKALFARSAAVPFFALNRTAQNAFEFGLLRIFNATANAIAPSLGNHLAFVIRKPR